VELAVCRAWNKFGKIPDPDLAQIESKASFSVERIDAIEKETRHDVIAFLTSVAERVGGSSRYIHLGLTSSDVLDTALAMTLRDSCGLIIIALDGLLAALKAKALAHKYTLQIGRSHGVHAEPISFGVKMLGFYAEFARGHKRLLAAREAVSRGKISGAVGTYTNISPELEQMVMNELGLAPALASTQVVARDSHAQFFTALAILGGSLERLAVEIRHLQRTEVLEAEEAFAGGQKGSSAMPHKRNPIASENISGQARLLRAFALAALENMALWHERDISHSSVERTIGPDACAAAHYSLRRMTGIVENLVIYPDNMLKNMNSSGGLIHSQQVLLALTEAGLLREEAYQLVQKHAMEVWRQGGSFKERLGGDAKIRQVLGSDYAGKLDKIFDPAGHLLHIDYIFRQVLPPS
ncbi:MAG: adenylosuccinate lyase, partial [Desulfarculales bacterium]|jgi:adenylosuccinate lyase|nr:adenylosuccinate lyase [Desulfarculales bacterium]